MKRFCLAGTHRAVAPETTWERIAPMLNSFGITRIADVTELDHLGIPVKVAVRPAAEILGTSQGKGATRLLAKLAAAMEAVELWHAERPVSGHFSATAQELDLPCALSDLHFLHSGFDASRLRLRWAWARALDNGEPVAVVEGGFIPNRLRFPTFSAHIRSPPFPESAPDQAPTSIRSSR